MEYLCILLLIEELVVADRVSFKIFQTLSGICGSKLSRTTAYHPQCNGKVERKHGSIKVALKAHILEWHNVSWIQTLPTVLLGLRTAIHNDINDKDAEMVHGESIKHPGEFFEAHITRSIHK